MKHSFLSRASIIVSLAVCCDASALHGERQDDAADAARLIEVLELRQGSVVADIGAGSGELAVQIAPK
jgi:hypothetical protein